jgi:hypothetical protein
MPIVSGSLIVILAVIHIVYGEMVQMRGLGRLVTDPIILGSTRVMIYQGGVILLGVGIIQLLKGMKRIRLAGAAAYIPVGIIILNILTFLAVSVITHRCLLNVALPQLIVFVIIIVLMLVELARAKKLQG